MSVCQYVRMQLFSLGIKMKVAHNVIRMSDIQKILVRNSLRTAKEPALVLKIQNFKELTADMSVFPDRRDG